MKLPWRVWVLIACLIAALIIIAPNPWANGVVTHQVSPSSPLYDAGIREGQKIISINDQEVTMIGDVTNAVAYLEHPPVKILLTTEKGEVSIDVIEELELSVDGALNVVESEYSGLRSGTKITEVNNVLVTTKEEFNKEIDKVLPGKAVTIITEDARVSYDARGPPAMTVVKQRTSTIKQGLDLEGGTRVLLKPVEKLSENDLQDMILILQNRLDVYGLSDLTIREANDLDGNQFILVEIAGLSKKDVEDILKSQGKFEARIGDQIVFSGGKQDIPYVCRNDGSCSGVRNCQHVGDGYQCSFEFAIRLSASAAERHAAITKDIPVITSQGGSPILEKQIDFYLDDKLVSSLDVSSNLKGAVVQDIAISGPGFGSTEEAASKDAEQEMQLLQTVLITGSLPVDIEIVKLDTVSPAVGSEFLKNAILIGIVSMMAVMAVIYVRYRKWKIVIPMMITVISEIILTLAFAPILNWNLDLAAIAGLIATVGTGVNDQIVIADESMRGSAAAISWKIRLKNAFFIIFTAYAATVVAMLPLFRAGAGLLRGFAITTIIGVTVGVLITRPAYAAIIEKWLKD